MSGLSAYLGNSGWLLLERVARLLINFFIAVLAARIFGPTEYGFLAFGTSVVAMLAPVAALGVDGVLLMRLAGSRADVPNPLVMTAIQLRLLAGLCLNVLLAGVLWFVDVPNIERQLLFILALGLLFQPLMSVHYFFQATAQARVSTTAIVFGLCLSAILKISILLTSGELIHFAWATAAESAFIAVFLMQRMRRFSLRALFAARREDLRVLFPDSWHLMLVAVVVTLFTVTDLIMLRLLDSPAAVGQYAVAARFGEATYFLFAAIAMSSAPEMARAVGRDSLAVREQHMRSLYEMMLVLALAIAIPLTLLATPLIRLLFGNAYDQSAAVLQIHIWTVLFVGWRQLSGKWFINEGLAALSLRRAFIGVVINVALNFLLIPLWSAMGAAVATLIAHSFVGMCSDWFDRRTRRQGQIKLESLMMRSSISVLTNYLSHKRRARKL